jgi:hypothetical protein
LGIPSAIASGWRENKEVKMAEKRNGKEEEKLFEIHAAGEGTIIIGDNANTTILRTGEGGDLFGSSLILPSRYHCPEHGDLLADEVVWQADGQPHCPHCGVVLQKVDER